MKRMRIDEPSVNKEGPPNNLYRSSTTTNVVQAPQQASSPGYITTTTGAASSTSTTTTTTTATLKVLSEGMQSSLYSTPSPVSYGAMPAAAAPHSGKPPQAMQPLTSMGGGHSRTKGTSPPNSAQSTQQPPQQQQQQSPGSSNFQRLKVEDALSYLDMVKYKFGDKPQVYNDFLDIMKEFKSQSIDTPGVIQRVSNLFRGYPELIVGFNTFLPPGYKIEVQRNDQGYAFQVSVSVPSPTGTMMPDPQQQQKPSMIFSGSGTIIQNNIGSSGGGGGSGAATLPSSQPLTIASSAAAASLTTHIVTAPTFNAVPPAVAPPPSSNVYNNSHGGSNSAQIVAAAAAAQQTIGSAPNALTLTAAHAAVSQALQGTHVDTPQNQPVEFNHAINYVNKIKNRFQGQPEKYKRFLEILHTYQKEQRTLKEACQEPGGGKHLTEQEVYSQVAKLFENQSDLLAEFGQFLPDATSHISQSQSIVEHLPNAIKKQLPTAKLLQQQQQPSSQPQPPAQQQQQQPSSLQSQQQQQQQQQQYHHHSRDHSLPDRHISSHKPSHHHHHHHLTSSSTSHASSVQVKRSPPYTTPIRGGGGAGSGAGSGGDAPPPPKKHKMSSSSSTSCRDVTLAEAGKFGSLNDYAFFDKVRKAVRSHEVYSNFLRCLTLFNQEIVSKSELVQLVSPFLVKFPELMRWFREFLGQHDVESVPYNANRIERPQGVGVGGGGIGEHAHDIDYSTAKRLGVSYCVIPPQQEGLRFSGRTPLCHEVLNNQWVSFPTWSEDSSFVGSRKNQYEEYMYRCEDERFELDVVIETNASTIRVLEGVAKKLNRMSGEELAKFRLDDCLGGSSPVLHQRALKRIYGDKAQDIIEGLKRNPAVAVPVVLRRLKSKEEEWREAQKGFNKIWREQNEKHYLKSLDYQGINFKQNDVKALRSKSLFHEIETIFEERNEKNEERVQIEPIVGPHLVFQYRDRSILDDAANLLIHHVKRQTGVQKGEKRRIKHIVRQFVPDLFFHPRQQLSDDEREDDDDKEEGNESPNSNSSKEEVKKPMARSNTDLVQQQQQQQQQHQQDIAEEKRMEMVDIKDEDVKVPLHAQTSDPDEAYTLFMASNNWYLFLRLHAILCERLAKIYDCAVKMAADESKENNNRKESTAVALRLKPKPQIEVEDYYPAFLDMVKNLLDSNMEANAYEDTLREMFGIHAYTAFTLDKVVSYAVRQLQHCVTERTAITCMELFHKQQKSGGCGGACATAHRRLHNELMYQHIIEKTVQDENCFKIYIYKNDGRMSFEMLDTDSDDLKKLEETKKWSSYKENFADCTNIETKPSSPLYLNRNMRKYNKRNSTKRRNSVTCNEKSGGSSAVVIGGGVVDEEKRCSGDVDEKRLLDDLVELNQQQQQPQQQQQQRPPEREQSEHRDYDVADDTQCRFNTNDAKIMFVANKDSFLYKRSALSRAKQTHPAVTKYKANRFRGWCKKWVSINVSDAQTKQCKDWLMGRGDNVVPNRTRVLTNNDIARTPYTEYNRYKVELIKEEAT